MGRVMPRSKRMENFEKYSEYNSILRTWFVAFGVGGPASFIVNDAARDALLKSGQLRLVVSLFLIGAVVQILVAILNKVSNWYCYSAGEQAASSRTAWQNFWIRLIDHYWIDFTADAITGVSFIWAIWKVFTIFSAG